VSKEELAKLDAIVSEKKNNLAVAQGKIRQLTQCNKLSYYLFGIIEFKDISSGLSNEELAAEIKRLAKLVNKII
jgi:hypothetical protein